MKENKYFVIDEFKCKCRTCKLPEGVPNDKIIDILVDIREHFNSPLIITSGYRCKEHNAKVNGAPSSRHLKGTAVDFVIKGVPTRTVFKYVYETHRDKNLGLGICLNPTNKFKGFVHVDTRDKTTYWSYESKGASLLSELQNKYGV